MTTADPSTVASNAQRPCALANRSPPASPRSAADPASFGVRRPGRVRSLRVSEVHRWSGGEDSNFRSPGPEPGALARLSHRPLFDCRHRYSEEEHSVAKGPNSSPPSSSRVAGAALGFGPRGLQVSKWSAVKVWPVAFGGDLLEDGEADGEFAIGGPQGFFVVDAGPATPAWPESRAGRRAPRAGRPGCSPRGARPAPRGLCRACRRGSASRSRALLALRGCFACAFELRQTLRHAVQGRGRWRLIRAFGLFDPRPVPERLQTNRSTWTSPQYVRCRRTSFSDRPRTTSFHRTCRLDPPPRRAALLETGRRRAIAEAGRIIFLDGVGDLVGLFDHVRDLSCDGSVRGPMDSRCRARAAEQRSPAGCAPSRSARSRPLAERRCVS